MVKRHKSFSAGERPRVTKRLKPISAAPPEETSISPTPATAPSKASVNLKRRGTFHTLEIAKKEGIMSRRPGRKTAAVEGNTLIVVFNFQKLHNINYIHKPALIIREKNYTIFHISCR